MDIIALAIIMIGVVAVVIQLNRNARRNRDRVLDPRLARDLDRDQERTLSDLNAFEQLARTPLFNRPLRDRSEDPDWITRA
jgi:hypothetical protein